MSIRRVTQLELENFASGIATAEEAEGNGLLSVADVRAQEMIFRKRVTSQALDDGNNEGGDLPSWADVYQNLLNAGVRARIAAFVAWATVPKEYRWPKTQEELAKQVLGLTSDRAIATWRKKFPEIDMMITELQAEEMLQYRPGAFRALGTVASDPSYRANADRRLFFEMSGDYTPKQKIETSKSNGAGRKLLQMLDKTSSEQLVESFGADAPRIIEELKRELEEEEILSGPPVAEATSPEIEENDLEGLEGEEE